MNPYEPQEIEPLPVDRVNPWLGWSFVFLVCPAFVYFVTWMVNICYRSYYELPFQLWLQ